MILWLDCVQGDGAASPLEDGEAAAKSAPLGGLLLGLATDSDASSAQ